MRLTDRVAVPTLLRRIVPQPPDMSDSPRNIVRHEGVISRQDRERLLGQRGCVAWFTGLSGSGKSTVARAAEELLEWRGDRAMAGRIAPKGFPRNGKFRG